MTTSEPPLLHHHDHHDHPELGPRFEGDLHGVEALSAALVESTSLRSLNLSDNPLGPQGTKAIAAGLTKAAAAGNGALEALALQHVGANANGAAAAAVKLSSVAKGKAPRENEATPPASEESESGSARGGGDDDDIVGVCTALVKMLSADGIGLTEVRNDVAHEDGLT